MDETIAICPLLFVNIISLTASKVLITPVKFMSIMAKASSFVSFVVLLLVYIPAEFMIRSKFPCEKSSIALFKSLLFLTSTLYNFNPLLTSSIFFNFSSFVPQIATSLPKDKYLLARERPIPELPPIIKTFIKTPFLLFFLLLYYIFLIYKSNKINFIEIKYYYHIICYKKIYFLLIFLKIMI